MSVTINEGTQTNILTALVGGTETQIIRLDIGSGTAASSFVGSIPAVGVVHNAGTIQSLKFGTVDTFYRHPDEFATTVSSGTSTLGTIKAAVSGSAIYITDLKISVQAASNVEIASGGTATLIMGTNFFAGSGGMVANYRVPLRTASGTALVYKQSVDTGLSIDVQGYVD